MSEQSGQASNRPLFPLPSAVRQLVFACPTDRQRESWLGLPGVTSVLAPSLSPFLPLSLSIALPLSLSLSTTLSLPLSLALSHSLSLSFLSAFPPSPLRRTMRAPRALGKQQLAPDMVKQGERG